MPWLETSNFMIIPCIWKKIWDRTVENTLMLPMLLSYGPVVHYGVCSTRGTGNRHWTWQTTMVEPDGWRAIGNDFVTRSRVCVFVCVFYSFSSFPFVRMLHSKRTAILCTKFFNYRISQNRKTNNRTEPNKKQPSLPNGTLKRNLWMQVLSTVTMFVSPSSFFCAAVVVS